MAERVESALIDESHFKREVELENRSWSELMQMVHMAREARNWSELMQMVYMAREARNGSDMQMANSVKRENSNPQYQPDR